MDDLTAAEKEQLEALLARKLASIPKNHLPEITLADIVDQTRVATVLPNIPPDIQLAYLLTNLPRLHPHKNLAIKSPTEQSLNLTRAVFFYRLDHAHQFQRYHDTHRWNVAIFLALLTQDADPNPQPNIRPPLPRSATAFITAFLEAIMEHHNTPLSFDHREAFIRLWKRSPFDLYTFASAQKKLLKNAMKRLSRDLERELGRQRDGLGAAGYRRRIAKFVGVLVHGESGQKLGRDGRGVVHGLAGSDVVEGGLREGELLRALRVPFGGEVDGVGDEGARKPEEDGAWVVSRGVALEAVATCRARDVLEMLQDRFGHCRVEGDML